MAKPPSPRSEQKRKGASPRKGKAEAPAKTAAGASKQKPKAAARAPTAPPTAKRKRAGAKAPTAPKKDAVAKAVIAKAARPRSMTRSAPPARRAGARKAAAAPVVAPVVSPLARSAATTPMTMPRPSPRDDREPDAHGRVMELHWGDDPPSQPRSEGLVQRWVKKGDALLRHLAEHGVARHEYRADLREGRFVWIAPDGRVSAEAPAKVICSWSRSTSVVAMAWSDPLVKSAGIARVDGMMAEHDDVDEEGAWRLAMEGAEAARADYLYRVTSPHAWYFLALGPLTFAPERQSWTPSTPVGLVLRTLAETRQAIESRAEPTDTVRERLVGVGSALLHEADYAYRGTDWVARLDRAGRLLLQLADRLPRNSYKSIAAGKAETEWLNRDATVELSHALALLEDEWALFA